MLDFTAATILPDPPELPFVDPYIHQPTGDYPCRKADRAPSARDRAPSLSTGDVRSTDRFKLDDNDILHGRFFPMFGISLHRLAVAAVGALAGVALIGGAALAWSGQVEGKPASFGPGDTDGYYVWHAGDGFHFRTTDSSGVYKYTGELHTDGVFTDVQPIRLEKDDRVDVLDGGHTVRYSFVTAEGIDGFDFRIAGGTHLGFLLKRDGTRIDTANIFLGEDGVHPATNPFRIHRTLDRDDSWTTGRGNAQPAATPAATGS